jgi:hypothetical protein
MIIPARLVFKFGFIATMRQEVYILSYVLGIQRLEKQNQAGVFYDNRH